jgi:hypothetical protein
MFPSCFNEESTNANYNNTEQEIKCYANTQPIQERTNRIFANKTEKKKLSYIIICDICLVSTRVCANPFSDWFKSQENLKKFSAFFFQSKMEHLIYTSSLKMVIQSNLRK